MPFTITTEDRLSREAFNAWASNPTPLPNNRFDIMIKGESFSSLNRRHVYARFGNTYISFYPDVEQRAIICPVPGRFLTHEDDVSIQDTNERCCPSLDRFRSTPYDAEDTTNRTRYTLFTIKAPDQTNIAKSLAQYFDIQEDIEMGNSITIPDKETWRFKFWTLTCCGLGCFAKKANCTSILINALPSIGLTTDLNRIPTWRRMTQDLMSILLTLYLTSQSVQYAQTDDPADVMAPIGLSFTIIQSLLCLLLSFQCFAKTPCVTSEKVALHDDERKWWTHRFSFISRYDLLQRQTNNSMMIMLNTVFFSILDIIINLGVHGSVTIIPDEGVDIGAMRLTGIIGLLLGIPRLIAVFGSCCFDIQNGPQNPVMLRKLLDRVAVPQNNTEEAESPDAALQALSNV